MTQINDILLGDEREADFLLSKNWTQSRLEKLNRFSLIAEMRPFLLEDIMPTGVYKRVISFVKDIKGNVYGRWTVLSLFPTKNKHTYWECICSCGTKKIVRADILVNGCSKSCNCLKNELISEKQFKHGFWKTRFYRIWRAIKERCNYKNGAKYKYYGGRGIKICKRWLEFINFKNDMFESYNQHIKKYGIKNTTIDRKDNNKGYYLKNCRWATYEIQNNNRNYP